MGEYERKTSIIKVAAKEKIRVLKELCILPTGNDQKTNEVFKILLGCKSEAHMSNMLRNVLTEEKTIDQFIEDYSKRKGEKA